MEVCCILTSAADAADPSFSPNMQKGHIHRSFISSSRAPASSSRIGTAAATAAGGERERQQVGTFSVGCLSGGRVISSGSSCSAAVDAEEDGNSSGTSNSPTRSSSGVSTHDGGVTDAAVLSASVSKLAAVAASSPLAPAIGIEGLSNGKNSIAAHATATSLARVSSTFFLHAPNDAEHRIGPVDIAEGVFSDCDAGTRASCTSSLLPNATDVDGLTSHGSNVVDTRPSTRRRISGGATATEAAVPATSRARSFLNRSFFTATTCRRRRSSRNSEELLGDHENQRSARASGGSVTHTTTTTAGAAAATATIAAASPRSLLSIETSASDDCGNSTHGCCSPVAEPSAEATAAASSPAATGNNTSNYTACFLSSPSSSSSTFSSSSSSCTAQTALLAVMAAAVASHAAAETTADHALPGGSPSVVKEVVTNSPSSAFSPLVTSDALLPPPPLPEHQWQIISEQRQQQGNHQKQNKNICRWSSTTESKRAHASDHSSPIQHNAKHCSDETINVEGNRTESTRIGEEERRGDPTPVGSRETSLYTGNGGDSTTKSTLVTATSSSMVEHPPIIVGGDAASTTSTADGTPLADHPTIVAADAASTASTADGTPQDTTIEDATLSGAGETVNKTVGVSAGGEQLHKKQTETEQGRTDSTRRRGEREGPIEDDMVALTHNPALRWWQLAANTRLFPATHAQQVEMYVQLLESLAACYPPWRLRFNSHAFFFHIFCVTNATSAAELRPYQSIFKPLLEYLGLYPTRTSAEFAAWTLRYASCHATHLHQRLRQQQQKQTWSHGTDVFNGSTSSSGEVAEDAPVIATLTSQDRTATGADVSAATTTTTTTVGVSAEEASVGSGGAKRSSEDRDGDVSVAVDGDGGCATSPDIATRSVTAPRDCLPVSCVAAASSLLPSANGCANGEACSTPSNVLPEGESQFLLLLRSTYSALDALYTSSASLHGFRLTPRLSGSAAAVGCVGTTATSGAAVGSASGARGGGMFSRGLPREQLQQRCVSPFCGRGGSLYGWGGGITGDSEHAGDGLKVADTNRNSPRSSMHVGCCCASSRHVGHGAQHSSNVGCMHHRSTGVRAAAGGGGSCCGAASTAAAVARFLSTPVSRFDVGGRRPILLNEPVEDEEDQQHQQRKGRCCDNGRYETCCCCCSMGRGDGVISSAAGEGERSNNSASYTYRRRERASAVACRQLLVAYRSKCTRSHNNTHNVTASQQGELRRRPSQHVDDSISLPVGGTSSASTPGGCSVHAGGTRKAIMMMSAAGAARAGGASSSVDIRSGLRGAGDTDATATSAHDTAVTGLDGSRKHTGDVVVGMGRGGGGAWSSRTAGSSVADERGANLVSFGLHGNSNCLEGKRCLRRRCSGASTAVMNNDSSTAGVEGHSRLSRVCTIASSPFGAPLRQQPSVSGGSSSDGAIQSDSKTEERGGTKLHNNDATAVAATNSSAFGCGSITACSKGNKESPVQQQRVTVTTGETPRPSVSGRSRRGTQTAQCAVGTDKDIVATSPTVRHAASVESVGGIASPRASVLASEEEPGGATADTKNVSDPPSANTVAVAGSQEEGQQQQGISAVSKCTGEPANDSSKSNEAIEAAAARSGRTFALGRDGSADDAGASSVGAAAMTRAAAIQEGGDGEPTSCPAAWPDGAAGGVAEGATGIETREETDASEPTAIAAQTSLCGGVSAAVGIAAEKERQQLLQQEVCSVESSSSSSCVYNGDSAPGSSLSRGESCISAVSNSSSRDASIGRNSEEDTVWTSGQVGAGPRITSDGRFPAFQLFTQGWWSIPVAKEDPPLDRIAGAALAASLPAFPGVVYIQQEHSFFALWRVKDGAPQRRRCDCTRLGVREAHRQAVQTVCRLTRRPPGVVYDSKSGKWSVCVTRHNGRHRASFSVKKFGFEGAHEKALEWYEAKRLQLGLLEPPVRGDSLSYIDEIRRAIGEEDHESLLRLFAAAVDAAPAALPQQEAAAAAWAAAAPDPRFPRRVFPVQELSQAGAVGSAAGSQASATDISAAGVSVTTEGGRKMQQHIGGHPDKRDSAHRKRKIDAQQHANAAVTTTSTTVMHGAGGDASAVAGQLAEGPLEAEVATTAGTAVGGSRRRSLVTGFVRRKGVSKAVTENGGEVVAFRGVNTYNKADNLKDNDNNAQCSSTYDGGGKSGEGGVEQTPLCGVTLQKPFTAPSPLQEEVDEADCGKSTVVVLKTSEIGGVSAAVEAEIGDKKEADCMSAEANDSSSCCKEGQVELLLPQQQSVLGDQKDRYTQHGEDRQQQQQVFCRLPTAQSPAPFLSSTGSSVGVSPVTAHFAAEGEDDTGTCSSVETVSKEHQQQMEQKAASYCSVETPSSIQTFFQDSDQSPSAVSSTTAGALSPLPSCCFDSTTVAFGSPEEEKRLTPSTVSVAAAACNSNGETISPEGRLATVLKDESHPPSKSENAAATADAALLGDSKAAVAAPLAAAGCIEDGAAAAEAPVAGASSEPSVEERRIAAAMTALANGRGQESCVRQKETAPLQSQETCLWAESPQNRSVHELFLLPSPQQPVQISNSGGEPSVAPSFDGTSVNRGEAGAEAASTDDAEHMRAAPSSDVAVGSRTGRRARSPAAPETYLTNRFLGKGQSPEAALAIEPSVSRDILSPEASCSRGEKSAEDEGPTVHASTKAKTLVRSQVLLFQQNGKRNISFIKTGDNLSSSPSSASAREETVKELAHPCGLRDVSMALSTSSVASGEKYISADAAVPSTSSSASFAVEAPIPESSADLRRALVADAEAAVETLSPSSHKSSSTAPPSAAAPPISRTTLSRGETSAVTASSAVACAAAAAARKTDDRQGSAAGDLRRVEPIVTSLNSCGRSQSLTAAVVVTSAAVATASAAGNAVASTEAGGGATRKRALSEKKCGFLVGRAGPIIQNSSWVMENRQKKSRAAEWPAWRETLHLK